MKRQNNADIPEFARRLPETTINGILAVLHNRAVLGLPDDSEARWERAVSHGHMLRYHWGMGDYRVG